MKPRAICFDFGDALADDATEEKDVMGVTQRADLMPGAIPHVQHLLFGFELSVPQTPHLGAGRQQLVKFPDRR